MRDQRMPTDRASDFGCREFSSARNRGRPRRLYSKHLLDSPVVGGEQMIPVSSTDRMILARLRALREDTAIAPPSKANRSSSQLAMTRSRSPTAEASGSDMPRVRLAGCGSRRALSEGAVHFGSFRDSSVGQGL